MAGLLLLLGCSQAIGQTSDAMASNDAFAAADETVEVPSAQHTAIYHEVLKFYRPAGNHMRLLNPSLLPSSLEQESGGTIEPAVAKDLVANLGDRFCVGDNKRICNGRSSGGELRVSPVYHQADTRVRVVVRYSTIDEYAPEMPSTQVFLLEQSSGRWIIRARR
jgi:hypothetical protein